MVNGRKSRLGKKVEQREKDLPILKVLSLFCDDYIEKNNLKLDDASTQSHLEQWNKQFSILKQALVAIEPTYTDWREKFWEKENVSDSYSLDGNSWLLTYLQLRPIDYKFRLNRTELNYLNEKEVWKSVVKLKKNYFIRLQKGVKPFFPLKFIEKTCSSNPSEAVIMQYFYLINSNKNIIINEDIMTQFKQQLETTIKDDNMKRFNVEIPQCISDVWKDQKFNEEQFNLKFPNDKKTIISFFFNVDAFFNGSMPNVFNLFDRNGEMVSQKEIRKREYCFIYRNYPQVILIPGLSYISYQTSYTILYGMLIQYAHIFLNKDSGQYYNLLKNRIIKLYSKYSYNQLSDYSLEDEKILKLSEFYSKSQNKEEIVSFEELKRRKKEEEQRIKSEEKAAKERESIHNNFQRTKNCYKERQEKNEQKEREKSWSYWLKNKVSSLKSYTKPILLSTGIITAGYAAYKMRQAYMNKNKQK